MNEEIKKYEYDELDLIHVYFDRKTNECKELVRKEKYDKLQNNWNELKQYISAEWYCFDNESVEFEVARKIMKKAQELEQGKDE